MKLLLAFLAATALVSAALAAETRKDEYELDHEPDLTTEPTGVKWTQDNERALAEATSDAALAADTKDAAAAMRLLEGLRGAYATDPLVAFRIGACSQYVMGRGRERSRDAWTESLLSVAEQSTNLYVRTFCLDQLRWCGHRAQAGRIRALGERSGDGNLAAFAATVVRELEGRAVGKWMDCPQPAKWISGDTTEAEKPAPMLVKAFDLTERPREATLTVAFAGWGEVYVNGMKAGRDVLAPVTCQPDRRISYKDFDVAPLLRTGRNEIGILLGNGWFNHFTRSAWGFDAVPWRSCPKARAKLRADGRTVLVTDDTWTAYDSPIVFNSLRNGEWYDARQEGRRDNARPAKLENYAPLGCVSPEDAAPCREGKTFEPVRTVRAPDGDTIYDFGANIAGWCEIDVKGAVGAKVTLDYDESLTPSNTLLGHVTVYVTGRGDPRPTQHDEYTLAGRADGENWHPRFTYHGFRYAKVGISGDAELRAIRARFVHSDFAQVGRLETSDRTFAALQAATCRSYLSNFVGIPTDCPHREKNGWTGDAQLAMETGLWNYDGRDGYIHFLRMLLDGQQPNGAIPCIVPFSPKFGLGWGTGPAWDAVLFEIPWQLFRFYGDDAPACEAYPAMKRYLSFIMAKADGDGLFEYGLGDWCPPDEATRVTTRLTDSAYVYDFNRRLASWAARFGEPGVAADCNTAADRIAAAFNQAFYRGNGVYAKGELTALAAPLYFRGLCVAGEEKKVVARLVEAVRERKHVADFGILGAKWVPRVLSDHGYADDAFRLFVQPEMPGWAHWLQSGDGTLCEKWDGTYSHNHIMFGDLSAWAYEYLGGIRILEAGFRKVAIRPQFPKGLDSFAVTHRTPQGEIHVSWKRVNGRPEVTYSVPDGVEVERTARGLTP